MTTNAAKAFLLLVVFCSLAWAGVFLEPGQYRESPADLKVVFIDVGQGDSILISPPSDRNVLIDGGGEYMPDRDAGADRVVPLLKRLGLTGLEYVILSHPHPDHAGGLKYVLDNFRVKYYRDPGDGPGEADLNALRRTALGRGVDSRSLEAGDTLDLGPGIKLKVLERAAKEFEKLNDGSLVLRLDYAGTSVLFPGDAEMEEEKWLVENCGAELTCDVLKAPHHGSYSSSSAGFLAAAAPKAVVISCGLDNPFEHPHSSTLAKYKRRKIRIYRTDYNGNITLTTNGKEFKIETQK